jgi:hypothetical protein
LAEVERRKMSIYNVLFEGNKPKTLDEVTARIREFEYTDASWDIIRNSLKLDGSEEAFITCAKRILSNFGMTRSGPFKDINQTHILPQCWKLIGDRVMEIHDSVLECGYSRDRYLLEISDSEREELTAEIWSITKLLLPLTMGKTSWGLVGASKILFSVLPEIVLPVDNSMWLNVFKTVDLGDVIRGMAFEIQKWEQSNGMKLNELYPEQRLSTLPSSYNVMAMAARPRK